jgi:inorganic pyrophosphatase
MRAVLLALVLTQVSTMPPTILPASATEDLRASLAAAAAHHSHVWRDSPPFNPDGTINGFIEIPRGERRKYELDMARNERRVDRVMPATLGGYPVNYGIVPQTISYDGDPFDVLVLGPPLAGGSVVRGVIVGIMHMEDETGLDSKVVLSRIGRDGKPTHALTKAEQRRIGDYFNRYKRHEPGKFSRVPGWDGPEIGRAFVDITHRFFQECREQAGADCKLAR